MKLFKWVTYCTSLLFLSSCTPSISIKEISPDNDNFYLIKSSSERMENVDKYFKHECEQRKIRHSRNGLSKNYQCNKNIIGLALSGGGMRSAAFQLGLLSGLHYGDILKRIDYISSVSGGGWANGAYWAWNKGDDLFFKCLDIMAKNGVGTAIDECKQQKNMLRTKQEVDIIALEQRKITWEDDIISFYLPHCNIKFSDSNRTSECWDNYYKKPYPIFNSTHSITSALDQGPALDKLPFEMTLDYLGTIYDCDKSRDCSSKQAGIGFFVKPSHQDYKWSNRKRPGKYLFIGLERIPGTPLSKAMAHSSGVASGVSALFEYNFDLLYKDSYIEELRNIYKLADGGKTENLGLIPLIERGNDLIIISYMGKDKDPVNNPFEDLILAKDQVKKLLGCDVSIPDVDRNNLIFESGYSCESTGKKGKIIHIKPSHLNTKDFFNYLENSEWGGRIVQYLQAELRNKDVDPDDRFPQTPTMIMEYDKELIQAYYLFGQYIAQNKLNGKVDQWISIH